jgi:hypothetical protein
MASRNWESLSALDKAFFNGFIEHVSLAHWHCAALMIERTLPGLSLVYHKCYSKLKKALVIKNTLVRAPSTIKMSDFCTFCR